MRKHRASFWTIIVFALIMGAFPLYANEGSTAASTLTKCRLVQHFKNQIDNEKESLRMLELLQAQKMEAKDLMSNVGDSDDVHEILILAEALEEEAGMRASSRSRHGVLATSAGVGSVILASYIVKRVNEDTRGLRLRQRVRRGVLPQRGQRLRKYGFNSALVLSIASTYWLAKEAKRNQSEMNYLYQVIDKLDRLKDLTESILKLRSDIQDKELILSERIMELEDEGLAKMKAGELICH